MLVIPYMLLTDNSKIIWGLDPHIQALAITFIIGILIIALFNFYVSIAQDKSFNGRFVEMVLILSIVTIISFSIGLILRESFGL